MRMRAITRARARVFGGINFGDLVKNSPIRQIKIPTKVSGYTVLYFLFADPTKAAWKQDGSAHFT